MPTTSPADKDFLSIFTYLSGRQLVRAAEKCFTTRNFRLATVISQQGGLAYLKRDASDQLEIWRKSEAISRGLVSSELVNIFKLLSGHVDEVCGYVIAVNIIRLAVFAIP